MTTMYDNRGKYFDAYAFNKAFDEYISKQTKKNELNDRVKTDDLNIVENIKSFYNFNLLLILWRLS